MSAIGYFIVIVIPLWTVAGARLGGAWTFAPVIVAFIITPLLDAAMGVDERNPDEDEERARDRNPLFDGILLAWVPIQLGVIAWGLHQILAVDHSWLERVGITMSVGVTCGSGGINIAHELIHRKSRLHRACGEILMASVTYTHFCVEHILGHHKHVATPDDPASARYGESLYAFLPRVIVGSLTSAWQLERARCARKQIPPWSLRDRRTRYIVTQLVIYAGVMAIGGLPALAFFAGQSIVAFGQLEVINYMEHYGLLRRKLESGRYERVTPAHSWNSAHRITGWYLFNLPRHADHHHVASRPYWKLRHVADSPQMPSGYAAMFVCAFLPPLWRRIMDPRVDAWNGGRTDEAVDYGTETGISSTLLS
jgi:alkane 1-monooxygenase